MHSSNPVRKLFSLRGGPVRRSSPVRKLASTLRERRRRDRMEHAPACTIGQALLLVLYNCKFINTQIIKKLNNKGIDTQDCTYTYIHTIIIIIYT